MEVHAQFWGSGFAMKQLRPLFAKKIVHTDPLVIQPKKDRYVVFFKYGVVVNWGMTEEAMLDLRKTAKAAIINPRKPEISEEIEIKLGKKQDKLATSSLHLTKLNVSKVVLISLILGRSVGLERYENEVNQALLDLDSITQEFARKGKTTLRNRDILKKTGLSMHIQNKTLTQLSLLDKPDVTWDDAQLDKLYYDLVEEYELEDRYQNLKEKLQLIFGNTEFIVGYLDSKNSILLEWIIVLLIFIEIIIFVYEVWWM